jgi:putative methionine-R-sulfoxide reductase with GAF domain
MDSDSEKERETIEAALEGYRSLMAWMKNIIHAGTQEQKEVMICHAFREMCGAEETSLFLFDRNAEHFRCRASASESGQKYRGGLLEMDQEDITSCSNEQLQPGRVPITVITEDSTYRLDDTYTLAVPVTAQGGTCAILLCEFSGPDSGVTSRSMEHINAFLVQLEALYAYSLDKDRLENLARSLELLYEIGTKLSSIRDEDTLLETILDLIEKNIKVDRCSLMILDEEQKFLRIKRAFGMDDVEIDKVKVPIGQGIAGYVATGTRPLLIKDLAAEKHLISQVPQKENFRTKSLLSVPLVAQGEVIGVINVNNRKDGLPFSEADMDLLSKIGSEIASVLQRSYMALQLKKARDLDKDIKQSMI